MPGELSEAGPAAASALADGFADATRIAMFTAAGFLVAGFAFAVQLRSRSDLADQQRKRSSGA